MGARRDAGYSTAEKVDFGHGREDGCAWGCRIETASQFESSQVFFIRLEFFLARVSDGKINPIFTVR